MTTAARPTWDTAKGGRGKGEGDLSALSKQYSSRDLPSHTKLKHRQVDDEFCVVDVPLFCSLVLNVVMLIHSQTVGLELRDDNEYSLLILCYFI